MRVLHTARGHPEAVEAVADTTTEALEAAEKNRIEVVKERDLVYETVYACQDEKLQISCVQGYNIRVVRANYGRFSIAICNDVGRTDFSVNCHSTNTLQILKKRYDFQIIQYCQNNIFYRL